MSYAINPREVFEYLIELGYKNITGPQLKEFIKDLRKLIKYDQRLQREGKNLENIHPYSGSQKQDIFTTLYEAGTASSKAKETTKKERVIRVQIKQPNNGKYSDRKEASDTDTIEHAKTCSNILSAINDQGDRFSEKIEAADIKRIESAENILQHSTHTIKPKTSFIRPRIPVKPCRSDPVALYHQYQAEWKRRKIPGESSHSDLRWTIRERMLGDSLRTSTRMMSSDTLKSKKLLTRL